jgi:sugar lactone lactonase YvrE
MTMLRLSPTISRLSAGLFVALTGALAIGCSSSGTTSPGTTGETRATAGNLWVANAISPPTVVEFTASQLTSATAAPTITIGAGSAGSDIGVAFDASGNLWVASNGAVAEYSASQLKSSGSPTPTVTLSGGSIASPEGLAFDAGGNLWVACSGNSTVIELASAQLATSGSPTPPIVISAPGSGLTRPVGLAFDASGDLWVANSTPSTVVEYTPAQLVGTGDPAPAVKFSSVAMSLSAPQFLAFDGGGNLWVANGEGLTTFTVAAYTPAQIAAGSGNPAPAIALSSFTNSDAPAGLAFDGSGDLWVSTINSIVEFTPSQLTATGAPAPTITIAGSAIAGASGLAFDPQTTGLPLQR